MNKQEWNEGLNHLDPDLVEKYVAQKDLLRQKKNTKGVWLRIGALAACFALIVSAIFVVPMLRKDGSGTSSPSIYNPSPSVYNPSPSVHNSPPQSTVPHDTSGIYQTTFDFDSYEEMMTAFREQSPSASTYTIQGLKRTLDESYSHFVDKVNTDNFFPQPLLDNKPITYQNKKGFSNITFFVHELYGLPWIWYFPSVSTGENFYIQITYLPDNIANQGNLTASEAIKALSPNAADIEKQYKNVYNQKIKLYDREVIALIYEYKDSSRNSTFFVYDNLLIVVRCNPEVWSAEWFCKLSFKNYKQ